MKFICSVILFCVLTLGVQAQFVSGPSKATFLAGAPTAGSSTVYVIAGNTTSNLPVALAVGVPVGRDGLGIGASIAGTNAASTTNALVVIELSANGTDFFLNNRITVGLNQTGTGYNPFYTNLPSTTVNLGNIALARVRSIQNTNIDSLFITNLFGTTR